MAVDGAHVYWANTAAASTIGRANLDGTGVDQSFITGANSPGGVAAAGHVYWANSGNGTIGRATLSGRGADQSFVTGADEPLGLAVRLTAPPPPTGVSASGGTAQATVSFTPPASNGGAAVSSFTVDGVAGWRERLGAASPIVVTGLTNGAAYTFTVTATNAIGMALPPRRRAR